MKDWKHMKIEELAVVKRGKFSARPRNNPIYYGGKYPFVQTGDVSGSNGRLRDYKQTLNEEGLKVSKLFPKGTLLLTIAANIGDVAMIEIDMACPDSLVGIIPRQGIDSDWLLHSLKMKKRKLETVATQNAQKNINLQVLRPLVLKVPTMKEQEVIGGIFRKWDHAISTIDRLVVAKLDLRKWFMQQVLSGKQRFFRFSEPWKNVRISDLFKVVKRPVNWDDDIEYRLVSVRRRSGGLFLRSIVKGSEVKTKNLCEIREGDFLISRRQVVHGACSIVKKEFDRMCVSSSYLSLRVRDPKVLDAAFFDWFSKTPKMYHIFFKSSHGIHIEKLFFAPDYYLKQTIRLPVSIREQQMIVSTLDKLSLMISLLERQLKLLLEQKKGLMQQLLTGKIRVSIPGAIEK